VTEWPRGLSSYVSAGPEEATPAPEEDLLANRLRTAARLLSLLRAQGRTVDREVARLRAIATRTAEGDRAAAARELDRLLADLDARADPERPG
jgi:hypothetical protein